MVIREDRKRAVIAEAECYEVADVPSASNSKAGRSKIAGELLGSFRAGQFLFCNVRYSDLGDGAALHDAPGALELFSGQGAFSKSSVRLGLSPSKGNYLF